MDIKVIKMYIAVVQILVIVILIFLTLLFIGLLFWSTSSVGFDVQSESDNINADLKIIREVITTDCYLHRLLMVETISNGLPTTSEFQQINCQLKGRDDVTFKKMEKGTELLGRALVRSFGGAISQRIASLMNQRNITIRDYYRSIQDVPSPNFKIKKSYVISPFIPTDTIIIPNKQDPSVINDHENISDSEDGTPFIPEQDIITLRKLESVTREIIDSISAAFHIRDVDYSIDPSPGETILKSMIKRPILYYEKLFNLIIMYDRELINQAKAYAAGQYDISMNCAQSSLEITYHIAEELRSLMHDNFGANTLSSRGMTKPE